MGVEGARHLTSLSHKHRVEMLRRLLERGTGAERGRRSAVAACRSGKIEEIPKAPGGLLCAIKAIVSGPMPR